MVHKQDIQKAVTDFTQKLEHPFNLKGIFFDMDGVLFDSMPIHAKSWHKAFEEAGLKIDEQEPYLNEGSTAFFTVKKMYKKYLNIDADNNMADQLKNRKHEIMSTMPRAEAFYPMTKLLAQLTSQKIDKWVVTGSAQAILLDRLEEEFSGNLQRDKMVTAYDVKIGKPHPEPYLIAMQKSGYRIYESFVVENAPLGVESAKAAGLFTIAVNTGPLNPNVLKEAGADIVFESCDELVENWDTIYSVLCNQ